MATPYFKSTDVLKTSDAAVEIRRSFSATQDLVFKAFTTPALIKRWMLGPPGWEMPVCEMDVREGGEFNWRWKNEGDKNEFGFHGVFREVRPSEKIVHTQTFDPGTLGGDMGAECLLTVTFAEEAGVTTVTTAIKYRNKEDMEKALATGMTEGMEMSYQQLDKVLGAS
jgi:uncharacterized protein YndB with AHSA1/START domain